MRRLLPLLFLSLGAGAAEDPSSPALPIAAAERAFAKRCGEVGIRASFLEYFAPEGVSFEPEPGNAHERLNSRPPPKEPPPVSLEWGPEQVEIAPSGDLGWSTGPATFTDRGPKPRPPSYGYYFSLWKKQPDGSYKVVLDLGTDTPSGKPVPTSADFLPVVARGKSAQAGPEVVRRRDEAFCKAAGAGMAKAYAGALASNARVHREGADPAVGDEAQAWAKEQSGTMTCKPAAAFAAAAPSLGYTYGSWSRKPDGGTEEKGYYVRVWRLEKDWRIAVEVIKPAKD